LINLETSNYEVDYILTHECPEVVFTELAYRLNLFDLGTYSLRKYFNHISCIVDFKHWYFGHYHEDINLNEQFSLLYKNFKELI
jgi:hypothetical protein